MVLVFVQKSELNQHRDVDVVDNVEIAHLVSEGNKLVYAWAYA